MRGCQVGMLVNVMVMWSLGVAACIACGNFVKCFADHCR